MLKIRIIKPPPDVTMAVAVDEWKACRALVEQYRHARQNHREQDAHCARLEIESYVPMGVYRLGCTNDHFISYGVILSSRRLLEVERLFVVPLLPISEIHRDMQIKDMHAAGSWKKIPLIDTGGFLAPIVGDCKEKRRYTRVADLVH